MVFWRVMAAVHFVGFLLLVAAGGDIITVAAPAILTILSLGIADILEAIHDMNSHSERTK